MDDVEDFGGLEDCGPMLMCLLCCPCIVVCGSCMLAIMLLTGMMGGRRRRNPRPTRRTRRPYYKDGMVTQKSINGGLDKGNRDNLRGNRTVGERNGKVMSFWRQINLLGNKTVTNRGRNTLFRHQGKALRVGENKNWSPVKTLSLEKDIMHNINEEDSKYWLPGKPLSEKDCVFDKVDTLHDKNTTYWSPMKQSLDNDRMPDKTVQTLTETTTEHEHSTLADNPTENSILNFVETSIESVKSELREAGFEPDYGFDRKLTTIWNEKLSPTSSIDERNYGTWTASLIPLIGTNITAIVP